jgi:23S rRNA (guanine745-N1)-methyltransferase
MNIVKAHNLACPIDGEPLACHGRQLVCDNGHAFDIARQGYVNLLPVQHKRTKHPGDSKAMVLARTQFLNSGFYEAIANQLNKLVYTQITAGKETALLDAGCGEGYYFNALLSYLSDKEAATDLSFIGLDISKEAIAQASKRNRQISWVVGTNRRPPVADESIDIILCLFGFLSVDGFIKVLKPGGKIIIVDPGPEHLKELREIIYPEIKKSYPVSSLPTENTGFSLVNREVLKFKVNLNNNEQINNLLIMTPHFYRASKAGREVACNLQQLDLTVDVVFSVLEKARAAVKLS